MFLKNHHNQTAKYCNLRKCFFGALFQGSAYGCLDPRSWAVDHCGRSVVEGAFFFLATEKRVRGTDKISSGWWPQWPGSHLLQFPEFLKIMPPAWETQEPVGTFHAYVYFKNLKQWIGNFNWRGNKVHPIFLMYQIPIFIFHKGVFILFLWCWLFKNKEVLLLVINETLGFLFFLVMERRFLELKPRVSYSKPALHHWATRPAQVSKKFELHKFSVHCWYTNLFISNLSI